MKYFTPLLLVCEAVLIYDFYRWGVSHHKIWSVKVYVVFIMITSALLAGAKWVDHLLENAAARDDAKANILIDYSIPSGHKNDPMQSRITVTNNSRQNLTDRHALSCESVLTVTAGGLLNTGMVSIQRNASEGGWLVMAGQPRADEIERSFPISGKGTSGNQDATTESCLAAWNIDPIVCSDVKITFYYFLETQPSNLEHATRRIVTSDDGSGNFEWYAESWKRPASRCCPAKGTSLREFNMWCYGNPLGPQARRRNRAHPTA